MFLVEKFPRIGNRGARAQTGGGAAENQAATIFSFSDFKGLILGYK
jgi:hypothetical protein